MRSGHEGRTPSFWGWAAPAACLIGFVAIATTVSSAAVVGTVRGTYDSERVCFEVTLTSPSPLSDGWAFQLFLDTDNDASTGYGLGFDLLIRGVGLEAPVCARNPYEVGYLGLYTTEQGDGPGGWGKCIRTVSYILPDDRNLTVCVPLGIGPLVYGDFRFALEIYHERSLTDGLYNRWTENGAPPDLDACLVDDVDVSGDGIPDTTTGDINGDGSIDLRDYAGMLECFLRPISAGPPARNVAAYTCLAVFDYDGDRDVDICDLSPWLVCLTGPS